MPILEPDGQYKNRLALTNAFMEIVLMRWLFCPINGNVHVLLLDTNLILWRKLCSVNVSGFFFQQHPFSAQLDTA